MLRLYDSITRQRAGVADDGYGNQVHDWSSPASVTYPAEVQPLSGTEDVDDQQRTDTRWRLWLPPDADLVATDRVVWEGDTYEVDGDVQLWKIKGRPHHLKAILVKITQGVV